MADAALCNGILAAAPCDAGRRATRGAVADSVQIGTKSSFPGGRIASATRPLPRAPAAAPPGQMNLTVCKAMRWWEKGVQPNMREVESAQDLADSLLRAGDQLVVVDFFSPGCGGCRALHPKISQLAAQNPDVQFLQVNYDTHKSMCYSLHVHVLPFFRLYRGPQGRVASFSCTNATINKFKDALAKHGTERCGLGPARGLDHAELLALAENRDLDFAYDGDQSSSDHPADLAVPVGVAEAIAREAAAPGGPWLPLPASATTTPHLLAGSQTTTSLLSGSR